MGFTGGSPQSATRIHQTRPGHPDTPEVATTTAINELTLGLMAV